MCEPLPRRTPNRRLSLTFISSFVASLPVFALINAFTIFAYFTRAAGFGNANVFYAFFTTVTIGNALTLYAHFARITDYLDALFSYALLATFA